MLPSSFQLQGGGAPIQLAGSAPAAAPSAIQPATNVLSYPGSATIGVPGGGGGGVAPANPSPAPAPFVDPYAQWGGQANYNALVSGISTGLTDINQSGSEAFGALNTNLMGGADNLINTVRTGQTGIDRSKENTELSRLRGIADIVNFVQGGMKQGASRLSNMNALDSSGSEAVARAYNNIGNRQSMGVNNQAQLSLRDIQGTQDQLNLTKTTGVTNLNRFRDQEVQRIGSDVRSRLVALDQQALSASLPDRVAIDQEKQKIIDAGMAQLSQVDAYLSGGLGGITPEAQDQVIGNANSLNVAGTAAPNPFNTGLPTGGLVPLSGPAISQLPIFTRAKKPGE